jgi:hypothetical protein
MSPRRGSTSRQTDRLTDRQSQGDSDCNWRFTANQFVLVTNPLRPTTSHFIFQLNTCGYSPYVTSCLTIDGSVFYNCCWSSQAQSFSGPSPAGLMTTFYCSIFETPPTWRARYPDVYPPGTGWSSYIPRHWVPFSSPPTTRRATVEVFDPTSTGDCLFLLQLSSNKPFSGNE